MSRIRNVWNALKGTAPTIGVEARALQSRALVEPIYRMGAYRRGIGSTEQQAEPGRLLTEGFRATQATAARAIAARVSDLPLEIQRRITDDEGIRKWNPVPDHPLLDVLEWPSKILTGRQLLKLTSYWLTQTGEAFWLIVTNGAGAPRELWPMSPRNIEKLTGTSTPVTGFVFHGEGGETQYSLDEVIWIFDPDPGDPFSGVGIVGPQARDFDAGTFASSTVRQYFQNDATPKIILKADTEADAPDQEQKEAFWIDWQNRYNRRGGENLGAPAFLPSGFTAQELNGGGNVTEAREIMEYQRDLLLMANGVPRSILGDVVDANRAAADTNQLVFDRHTIKPQTGLIADAITQQLVRPTYGVDWRARFDGFIADDEDLRLREEAQDLALKVRSVNQVRSDRGLDPNDWGDFPIGNFGDSPYDPEGDLGDLGDQAEPDPDPEPEPEPEPGDPIPVLEEEPARAFVVPLAQRRIMARLTPEATWSRVMQTEAVFVPRMLAGLRQAFSGQKALTIEALKKAPGGSRSYSRTDWLDSLFGDPEMSRLFETLVTPISLDIFTKTGSNVLASLEERPQLAFNEQAVKEMREEGANLVTYTSETTKAKLRRTLSKGIENGERLDELVARTRKAYREISSGRARTIARTEVGFAMSKGQLAGYQQSKSVFKTRWNTARDERVRDAHQLMEGVEVLEGTVFTIPRFGRYSAETALAPRVSASGGRLSAHNGINCRCFDSAVLGE